MVGIGLLQLPATPRRQKENAYVRYISRSSVKTSDSLRPSFNAVCRPLAQTRISLADRPVWTRQKVTSVLAAPVDLSRKSFYTNIMTSFFLSALVSFFPAKSKKNRESAEFHPPSPFSSHFLGIQTMEMRAQISPRI